MKSNQQTSFYLFILMLFICSTFQGCKKDPKPTYYLDQELKDYCYFTKGSYWVYEDTLNNFHDSEIVLESSFEKVEIKNYNLILEVLLVKYKSDFWNTIITSNGNPSISDLSASECVNYWGDPNIQSYDCRYVSYSDSNKILNPIENSKIRFFNKLDSLTLNNKTYFNVKIFQNKTQTSAQTIKFIWYAKNIGIIKKEMFDGKVWLLKDYNVKQD